MSTGISWTDETWNPVVGCTRVSEGCRDMKGKVMLLRDRKGADMAEWPEDLRRREYPR